ncbi:MAG: hypothetical protein AB2A00_05415 [Myxococcota bacterium]
MTTNPENPIPPAQQALLDLFTADLKDLKFPDVDRDILEEAAARVREHAEQVAQAEAALAAAREKLAEHQEGLLQKCQRAMAYARVWAEENEELSQRLDAIALPRSARRARSEGNATLPPESAAPVRKRGRPPKARAELFEDGSNGAALENGNGHAENGHAEAPVV